MSKVARGFIRGVLWGTGVSLGGVILLSVAVDGPSPQGWQQQNASTLADQPLTGQATIGSSGNRVALTVAETSVGLAPSPDTLRDIAVEAFDPAQVPETGLASDLPLSDLPSVTGNEGIAPQDTSPPKVASATQPALTTPATEPDLSISTEPAQPPTPAAVQPSTAFATAPSDINETEADDIASTDIGSSPTASVQVADAVSEPAIPDAPESSGLFAQVETEAIQQSVEEAQVAPIAEALPVQSADSPSASPVQDVPVAMTDAPTALSFDADGAQEELAQADAGPEVTKAEETIAEAPQPKAASNIDLALAAPTQTEVGQLPQIAGEAEAPEVPYTERLDEPVEVLASATGVDKSTADVKASTELDVSVAVPEAQDDVAVVPAGPGDVAPASTVAPDVINAAIPDSRANADLTSVRPIRMAQATVDPTQPARSVKINRLPTLGDPPQNDSTGLDPATESETADEAEAAVQADAQPVQRYAQPFDNPEGKPAMAVVMMDDGIDLNAGPVDLAALRALPYPVTVAVDADLADAKDRMDAYLGAGLEVLAMVNFPQGATATDAEVNLSVALDRMPRVVGVLEGVVTGVQTTRDSGRQVAEILAQTGHGFVTQNKGLNTVQKLAARQGVPSGVVFRDFDVDAPSARVMTRLLDQAAFRAGQDGAVILLGRMRDETIAALMVWALQDRASQVALAPVTGALRTQNP